MAPAHRLRSLLDLSRTLSSSLDLSEVLREFTAHAAELTGATAAELSSYDPERGVLVMLVEYAQGEDEITERGGQVYALADYPATRRVLERQEPYQLQVSDSGADPAERALLAGRGQGSLLMLPLVARGETIGLMEVVDETERTWHADDVEFCRALCDIVAIAIRNAVLFSELQESAARDTLTGLYNRRLFEEQFKSAVAHALRAGEDLTLLVVDLDGLKRINDHGGHMAGDLALRALADALRASIRSSDVACRIGGDEFGIILLGSTPEDAISVSQRAQDVLSSSSRGQYSFSGGVARVTPAQTSAQEVFQLADLASYRAKAAGGARTLLAVESRSATAEFG